MKKNNNTGKESKLKIGGNIRKWRNLHGIKQKELALKLDVSEAAISNIENNITDISLSQLEGIAQGLDVPLEKLFTDPQETMVSTGMPKQNFYMQPSALPDKELLNAVINSLQKKDEQLQSIIQQVINTMGLLMGQPTNNRRHQGNGKQPYELNE